MAAFAGGGGKAEAVGQFKAGVKGIKLDCSRLQFKSEREAKDTAKSVSEGGGVDGDSASGDDGDEPSGNGWDTKLKNTNLTGMAFALGPITWEDGCAIAEANQLKRKQKEEEQQERKRKKEEQGKEEAANAQSQPLGKQLQSCGPQSKTLNWIMSGQCSHCRRLSFGAYLCWSLARQLAPSRSQAQRSRCSSKCCHKS